MTTTKCFKRIGPSLSRVGFIAVLALPTYTFAAPIVFSAAGADAAAIQGSVDDFRDQLGTLNANVAGSFGSGRREINWDGVPDALSAPNNLPPNFFNVNSPRGVEFSTPGLGVQVSGNEGVAPIEFDNLDPGFSSLFRTFSAQRLFTSLDSTITDVDFFVPASNTQATTTGFGAVFTDVDVLGSTTIQYFDTEGNSLGIFDVPAVPNQNETLSFLGVYFDEGAVVSRVRITSGNQILAAGNTEDGTVTDLVAMDDFIYGEPVAQAQVSESSTLIMLGSGLLALAGVRQRRQASSAQ